MLSTPSCPKSADPPLAAAARPVISISAAALLISMRLRRSMASGLFGARPGVQTQRRLLFCALALTIWACREHRQLVRQFPVRMPAITSWACREQGSNHIQAAALLHAINDNLGLQGHIQLSKTASKEAACSPACCRQHCGACRGLLQCSHWQAAVSSCSLCW